MESAMKRSIFYLLLLTINIFSCEEQYLPSIPETTPQYVVEGYVEAGYSNQPVIVILTKSIPYLSKVSAEVLANSFVKGAKVSVNDQQNVVQLTEVCLNDLSDDQRKMALELIGLEGDSIGYNICVYVDIFNQVKREIGRSYDLKIDVNGEILSSTTTIPSQVPLYNLIWEEPPGAPNDTLAQLKVHIDDPGDEANFYRYFTSSNGGALIAPFSSVTDDVFFNGQSFEFPLSKAESRDGDFDPDTFGLFMRGDSVTVKWCTIDKAHFDFWNTRDNAANNNGPFSSYTRIASNIQGGQGIWGGYAVNLYHFIVPPK